MSEEAQAGNEIVATERKAITVTVAERYGMEPDAFEVALRNTVFLEGSRAEYAAFLVVCNEYRLNPLTKEIYAFKNKQTQKIVPVVSVDGWVTLCNTHPAFDGMTFEDNHDPQGKLFSITCTIFRKDRSHPTIVTEYLSECIRDTAPWKMQHRMLRHKALQQAARYAFGFSGIYDEDDAAHMEAVIVDDGFQSAQLLAAADFKSAPKPARRPRKPEGAVTPNDAGQADKGPEASQERQEGGEFSEGEFEDACSHAWEDVEGSDGEEQVCVGCGMVRERPTTPAADTATDGARPAQDEPATSGSASDASEASQAQAGSSQPPASETTSAGSRAPHDTVYTLASDEVGEDGKVPTYKNGQEFSRVKPDSKAKPPTFDAHAETVDEAEAQEREPEQGEGGFDDDRDPAEQGQSDVIGEALAKIAQAPHFPAARQIQRTLAKTDAYAEATLQAKAGVRLALWKRYTELVEQKVETVQPYEDFLLMRMFLEFGAVSVANVDEVWMRFWRHAAYKDASQGDKDAMNKLMVSAKERVKEAANG